MKALAARTRDIDDLRQLAGMISVETADAALLPHYSGAIARICLTSTRGN